MSTSQDDIRARFLDFRRRLYGAHDLSAVDDYLHPDFRSHNPLIAPGQAAYKDFVRGFHEGLPDLTPVDQHVLVEGDRLMAMARWEATHAGTFRGIPATGKRLGFETADLYQLRGGRLYEHWDVADRMEAFVALGLLQQVRPSRF